MVENMTKLLFSPAIKEITKIIPGHVCVCVEVALTITPVYNLSTSRYFNVPIKCVCVWKLH